MAKFDSDRDLAFATYIGGSSEDYGSGVVCDPTTGDVIVLGTTRSSGFPIINSGNASGDDNTLGGDSDLFLARYSNNGTLIHSRYFGGANTDETDPFLHVPRFNPCNGIAIDPNGNIFVTGTAGDGFPTIWPEPTQLWTFLTFSGVSDAFIAALTPGFEIEYYTYLGGTAGDRGTDVAVRNVDGKHEIVMVGYSSGANYPTAKLDDMSLFNPQFIGGIDGVISLIRTNLEIVRTHDIQLPDSFVAISPNPATDFLSLETKMDDLNPSDIQVYDLHGRLVLRKSLSGEQNKWTFSIQHLHSGAYNIVLNTSAGPWSGKFVKIDN